MYTQVMNMECAGLIILHKVGETFDCTDKRNCIMLTGLFQCRRGQCTEVSHDDECLCFFSQLSECPVCTTPSL